MEYKEEQTIQKSHQWVLVHLVDCFRNLGANTFKHVPLLEQDDSPSPVLQYSLVEEHL